MKNKEENKLTQGILLIAVLGIWGLIAFRFFNFNNSTTALSEGTVSVFPKRKGLKNQDIFSLKLDYKNPFVQEKEEKNTQKSVSSIKTHQQLFPKK